MDLMKY